MARVYICIVLHLLSIAVGPKLSNANKLTCLLRFIRLFCHYALATFSHYANFSFRALRDVYVLYIPRCETSIWGNECFTTASEEQKLKMKEKRKYDTDVFWNKSAHSQCLLLDATWFYCTRMGMVCELNSYMYAGYVQCACARDDKVDWMKDAIVLMHTRLSDKSSVNGLKKNFVYDVWMSWNKATKQVD